MRWIRRPGRSWNKKAPPENRGRKILRFAQNDRVKALRMTRRAKRSTLHAEAVFQRILKKLGEIDIALQRGGIEPGGKGHSTVN